MDELGAFQALACLVALGVAHATQVHQQEGDAIIRLSQTVHLSSSGTTSRSEVGVKVDDHSLPLPHKLLQRLLLAALQLHLEVWGLLSHQLRRH